MSTTVDGVRCKYGLSIIDHLTRFAPLVAIPNTSSKTVSSSVNERLIYIFSRPETLHPDQGMDFESQIIYHLQLVLEYHTTKTTPYHPQGRWVFERIHVIFHAVLATHVDMKQQDWPSLFPFVQLTYNIANSSTV